LLPAAKSLLFSVKIKPTLSKSKAISFIFSFLISCLIESVVSVNLFKEALELPLPNCPEFNPPKYK